MLQAIPSGQRDPISAFLTSFYNQTKRSTISLKSLINNIVKAYQLNKFGLTKILEYNEVVDEKILTDIIEKSVEEPTLKQQIRARKYELDSHQKAFKKSDNPSPPNYKKRAIQEHKQVIILYSKEIKRHTKSQLKVI